MTTTRTIGLVASLVSSAVGAWYWIRHRRTSRSLTPAREHGTVILDTTPQASEQSPLA